MLILVLIDVQYSQKAVFHSEKGSNCQNHSSSGSLHPVKNFHPVKFLIPSPQGGGDFAPPLTTIWKTQCIKTRSRITSHSGTLIDNIFSNSIENEILSQKRQQFLIIMLSFS